MPSVIFIKRLCKGAIYVPIGLIQSGPKSIFGYSNVLGPLRKCFLGSVELNKNIASAVASLLYASCPSAIFWSVVTPVINSLKRHSIIRLWPEVAKEILKRVEPSITNANTPTSVVQVGDVVWVKTPLFHGSPRLPFCGVCHSVGAVISNFGDIRLKTTARLRPSAYKFGTNDGHFVSTFANAIPLNFTSISSLSALINNSKSIKVFACKVEFISQNILRMNIARVKGTWQSNTVSDFQPLSLATRRNYTYA